MRVLICGDRYWSSVTTIRKYLNSLPKGTVVIVGGARGADTIARKVAEELGLGVVIFPADWEFYGRAAGPIRNKKMLMEGKPDLVVAFHNDLTRSKGTRNMIQQAKKAGVKVEVRGE